MIIADIRDLLAGGLAQNTAQISVAGSASLATPHLVTDKDSLTVKIEGTLKNGTASLVLYGGKGDAMRAHRTDKLEGDFTVEYTVDPISLSVYAGMDEFYVAIETGECGAELTIKSFFVSASDGSVANEDASDVKRGMPVPNKMLMIGNSLIFGMQMRYGMCSTAPGRDYFHYVSEYVRSKNPNAVIEKLYGSSYESAESIPAYYNWCFANNNAYTGMPSARSFTADTDLITIQLGDNINTEKKYETFAQSGDMLIDLIKEKCPHARIIWIHGWYNRSPVYEMICDLCQRHGIERLFIGDLRTSETECHDALTFIDKNGEAQPIKDTWRTHPGDVGMRKIADRIIENLGFGD